MRWLAIALAMLAGPAQAQDHAEGQSPMTGAEFEAAVTGKTLNYFDGFAAFGTEMYREGRRTRWAFAGDACVDGTWNEPQPGRICFSYDGYPGGPHCWAFYATADGLVAEYLDDPPDNRARYLARPAATPLSCPGPRVGS